MKWLVVLVASIVFGFLMNLNGAHLAYAQDVFSSGDSGSNESFDAGGTPNENFDGGPGPDGFTSGPRYRPLPGYTNCGPWYNSYANFVKTMMAHYAGFCQVRNGNQVWCHARLAGNCNPDATGGNPNSPILDTGMRYTPNCQSVCDRTVAEGGHYSPVATKLPPPPCDMPSLEQLALPPDDGDVVVAIAMSPSNDDIGGDVATAEPLSQDGADIGGDVAIALALPTTTTLTGGVSQAGVFFPPPKPVTLRGKATINGWPVAPDQHITLQGHATQNNLRLPPQQTIRLRGYATKSLRIPVTYKSKHQKTPPVSADTDAKIHTILSGGTHKYSEDEGRYRFMSGFLQGMAAEMQQQARTGEAEKAKDENINRRKYEKTTGKMCEIKANPPSTFEDAVKHPDEDPAGAGKFITDMIDKIFHHNKDLAEHFPKLEKSLKFLGPLLEGAGLVKSFKETYEVMAQRDERIKKIIDSSADQSIDPAALGWFAGQDAADSYALTVRSIFSLGVE